MESLGLLCGFSIEDFVFRILEDGFQSRISGLEISSQSSKLQTYLKYMMKSRTRAISDIREDMSRQEQYHRLHKINRDELLALSFNN